MGKRSIPVTIVGAVVALFGFIMTVSLLLIAAGPLVKHVSFEEFLATLKLKENDCVGLFLSNTGMYWVNLVFSLAAWAAGIGVVFMKDWGRQIVMALGVIELLWLLGDIAFAGRPLGIGYGLFALALVGLIVYMALPSTRDKFHPAGGR